jgi:hypothetical protein
MRIAAPPDNRLVFRRSAAIILKTAGTERPWLWAFAKLALG